MSASRRLIVNADGYGFTPGVNAGITACLPAGIVRSMSCTPNFGFLDDLKDLAAAYPHVSIGVHFNLSVGRPVSDPESVPSLVNGEGRFLGPHTVRGLVTRAIRRVDIERELTAQADVVARTGVPVTHWDGHQNLHLFPGFFGAAERIARRFGIERMRTHRRVLYSGDGPLSADAAVRYYLSNPARVFTHGAARARMAEARRNGFRMADSLVTPGYVDATLKSLREFWVNLAVQLPVGTHEVYCHPAVPDDLLRQHATYVEPRRHEAEILSDSSLAEEFARRGVQLMSFHDV